MSVRPQLSIKAQVAKAATIALGLIIGTWAFFGPVMAWHHITVFGILGGVVLNGEGPHDPIRPRWGDEDVIIHPDRLAISGVLWLLYLVLLFWICRKLARWADVNLFQRRTRTA